MTRDVFDKIRKNVQVVGDKLFLDRLSESVGDYSVDRMRLVLGYAMSELQENGLLVGEPGWGKTTYAAVMSATTGNLPADLYLGLQVQCHPDQTKDTMFARADLGRLAEEGVVWQPTMYLDSISFDEFNRNPEGKQAIAQEFIRTGRMEHLGHVFNAGKRVCYATMNFNGGTHKITPANLDRFGFSIEFGDEEFDDDQIIAASDAIERELFNPGMTDEILDYLGNKQKTPEDKLKFLDQKRKEYEKQLMDLGIEPFTEEDRKYLAKFVREAPFTSHGGVFKDALRYEFNFTNKYGFNRSSDPADDSNHNREFASSNTKKGLSPRALSVLRFYSSFLAGYSVENNPEKARVDLSHVRAIAPYIIAHRSEYTEEFKGRFSDQPRLKGEREDMDLARRLVNKAYENLTKKREGSPESDAIDADRTVLSDIMLLDAHSDGEVTKPENIERVTQLLSSLREPDHPLLRKIVRDAKRQGG